MRVLKMKQMTIDQLHQLRLDVFENAESLHKEARLLLEHGFFARAYLLAYFCCEELGKLPMIVGAVGGLQSGDTVDWKKVMKRFRDHKAKVDSDDVHHYMFGIDLDLENDSDLKWLAEARELSHGRVVLKNKSTYVDVQNGRAVLPLKEINFEHASKMLERAFESLCAHWRSESLVNPIVREVVNK
ncbi:abortive infection protein, AbiV family [Pseudomonas sp. NFACC24-1]|uniref:AbiV family abortive infection protein n=1 Tax=Pseudomonas sp. NFACC24-1 TaxID=1566189 RepID=UPI0008EDB852|nr:AbiV family abortive infection protein [Pseudomonas sp. NFACC24-1]SFN51506.1 abortive infection protein, AbiV family [Pseudomonas sp. NFACC24-1]